MVEHKLEPMNYIYNYSCRKEEVSLCKLEMRAFFGADSTSSIMESSVKIDANRSPFLKERIDVLYEGNTVQEIKVKVKEIKLFNSTFKVIFLNNPDSVEAEKVRFKERQKIEREIGLHISGEPDLENPNQLFAIMYVNGRWVFGNYHKSEPIWLHHQKKPNGYSVALSTRVARAVANIAAPDPTATKVIDPCCGIGTVLVEALSMGMDIVGSDFNPLIISGVRENIAHFGLHGEVTVKDVRNITDSYDVAIIDLPYNLCSVITPEEQLEMLQSARNFTRKLIIVTVEPVDDIIEKAGFQIVDRCVVTKGINWTFTRQVIVCQ